MLLLICSETKLTTDDDLDYIIFFCVFKMFEMLLFSFSIALNDGQCCLFTHQADAEHNLHSFGVMFVSNLRM